MSFSSLCVSCVTVPIDKTSVKGTSDQNRAAQQTKVQGQTSSCDLKNFSFFFTSYEQTGPHKQRKPV